MQRATPAEDRMRMPIIPGTVLRAAGIGTAHSAVEGDRVEKMTIGVMPDKRIEALGKKRVLSEDESKKGHDRRRG